MITDSDFRFRFPIQKSDSEICFRFRNSRESLYENVVTNAFCYQHTSNNCGYYVGLSPAQEEQGQETLKRP
jgi:hypothetical protein